MELSCCCHDALFACSVCFRCCYFSGSLAGLTASLLETAFALLLVCLHKTAVLCVLSLVTCLVAVRVVFAWFLDCLHVFALACFLFCLACWDEDKNFRERRHRRIDAYEKTTIP